MILKQSVAGVLLGLLASVIIIYFIAPDSFIFFDKVSDLMHRDAHNTPVLNSEVISGNFDSVASFFIELSIEKGGAYAYQVLAESQLPPNIDTHLVGHLIGDNLYKQEGLDGMQYCTSDFRNACSHAVVIGALLNEGMGIFDEITEVCQQAPGAGMAYSMCFHGFGHGVLAFVEYELPDAIELCQKVGTEDYYYFEFNECVGGAIMEMRGGIHDPATWQKKAEKYLDFDNPATMCTHDFVPEAVREICFIYLTPFIFDAVGAGDLPSDLEITNAFKYCSGVSNEKYRKACYGGFGKEFVVFAQGRDVRKIEELSDAQLAKISFLCTLAENTEASSECLTQVGNSLFWGGQYHPSLSTRFCALIADEQQLQKDCYFKIIERVKYFDSAIDDEYRKKLCGLYPNTYKNECTAMLLEGGSL